MCSGGCWYRWAAMVACVAAALTASAVRGQDTSYGEAVPTQMIPDQIAVVFPDGTHGPWMDYVVGNSSPSAALGAIFDTYEADPFTWNLDDNIPFEVYDRPKGSGNFCVGQGDSRRFFWCHVPNGCPNPFPSCANAHGGKMAANHPKLVQGLNFLWGTVGGEDRLEAELLFFDTYNGTGCSDPGTNQVGGILAAFDNPAQGFYYTSVNLTTEGLEFDAPGGERIGYQVNFYKNQQNKEFSTAAYPGLWQTKNPDWDAEMGVADLSGYSDAHGNKDCKLDNQDRCVGGTGACPVVGTIRIAGPGMLLLGEGGGGEAGCVYKISKNSKAKKGCTACPKKNDLYSTGDPCEVVKDCAKKIKIKQLDCPDGGPGFCKKVLGKREACEQP